MRMSNRGRGRSCEGGRSCRVAVGMRGRRHGGGLRRRIAQPDCRSDLETVCGGVYTLQGSGVERKAVRGYPRIGRLVAVQEEGGCGGQRLF